MWKKTIFLQKHVSMMLLEVSLSCLYYQYRTLIVGLKLLITKGWEQVPVFQHIILPVVKVVWGLFTSHRTFNDILMLVNVFLNLKITLLKTLDFLQQTSQWMRMRSGKWRKITVLWEHFRLHLPHIIFTDFKTKMNKI
jgi:hypothetical protein